MTKHIRLKGSSKNEVTLMVNKIEAITLLAPMSFEKEPTYGVVFSTAHKDYWEKYESGQEAHERIKEVLTLIEQEADNDD